MTTVLTVLEGVHDLLSKPGAHTTDAFALNGDYHQVNPCADTAKCWCWVGGIQKICDGNDNRLFWDACAVLVDTLPDDIARMDSDSLTLVEVNDTKTTRDILHFTQQAIDKLKGQTS